MANDRKQAIDIAELDSAQGTAQLELRTYKASRDIVSSAHVHHVKDGFLRFELYGDFSKVLARSPVRGTQANLDTQHARIFTPQAIEALKAEAIAFYAAKRSKAAA